MVAYMCSVQFGYYSVDSIYHDFLKLFFLVHNYVGKTEITGLKEDIRINEFATVSEAHPNIFLLLKCSDFYMDEYITKSIL